MSQLHTTASFYKSTPRRYVATDVDDLARMDFEISRLFSDLSANKRGIEDLYRTDAVFAEICDDYLLLKEMKSGDDELQEYVLETVESLRTEIEARLNASPRQNAD